MLDTIEALVRAGLFEQAGRKLRSVNLNRVPRADVLRYAVLARRTGDSRLSLKLLGPIVYGEKARGEPATSEERIAFAAALIRLGALDEAGDILKTIDESKFPEAWLQGAIRLFSEWRYAPAIPLLRSYVKSQERGSYTWCVGQVNLTAALVQEEERETAWLTLKEMEDTLRDRGFDLLRGNSLELAAQLEILDQNWEGAFRVLTEAGQLLKETRNTASALYIQKWRAIASSLQAGVVLPELSQAREDALGQKAWEVVRDCDFYAARITGDRSLLLRLYFGTPYATYRERILAVMGEGMEPQASFLWNGGLLGKPRGTLDLSLAELSISNCSSPVLGVGHVLHRLLILLCEDFYKPAMLVTIFARIFPGERFNPFSSPNRVHQLIRRLRGRLTESAVPLAIDELAGCYRLRFLEPFTIRIPCVALPRSQREIELQRLLCCVEGDTFAAKDVRGLGEGSRATVARILKWAVEAGKLEALGRGPKARYRRKI